MEEIRNSSGKLICCVDTDKLIVEIVHRHIKTIIRIIPGRKPEVSNSKHHMN